MDNFISWIFSTLRRLFYEDIKFISDIHWCRLNCFGFGFKCINQPSKFNNCWSISFNSMHSCSIRWIDTFMANLWETLMVQCTYVMSWGSIINEQQRLCKIQMWLKAIIVLMDLNEFSPIFWKVQHSHSRQKKTTSLLLGITLKGRLRVSNECSLEGAMYINLW